MSLKKMQNIFTRELKAVCDRHHPSLLSKFKKWADDYFFLKHRNDTACVGADNSIDLPESR
jgi:coproporphyrinogen III oxidase